MKRHLTHWFRRITGSLEAQIAERMREERESALDRWVPQQEPEPSRLDFADGVGRPRTEELAKVLEEARVRSRLGDRG